MTQAKIDGMNVKVDKFGRIVLPKPVRERLQLRAGMNLELEEIPGRILLRPIRRSSLMVGKDGMLVHPGKLPRGFDWDRLMEDSRDAKP